MQLGHGAVRTRAAGAALGLSAALVLAPSARAQERAERGRACSAARSARPSAPAPAPLQAEPGAPADATRHPAAARRSRRGPRAARDRRRRRQPNSSAAHVARRRHPGRRRRRRCSPKRAAPERSADDRRTDLSARAQSTACSKASASATGSFSSPSLARRVPRRAPERSRARFRARPHDLRSDAAREHVDGVRSAPQCRARAATVGQRSRCRRCSSTQTERGPHVALDQLWLRFDIAHTVFVTAGTQHVRWGTAHFWTPTDFLHLRHRNPLDVFDARTGTTMVKLHLPIESKAWNFYALRRHREQYGHADVWLRWPVLRARSSCSGCASSAWALFARAQTTRKFAADLSIGIGDFDVYGGARARDSERNRSRALRRRCDAPPPDATVVAEPERSETALEAGRRRASTRCTGSSGYRPQVVGGLQLLAQVQRQRHVHGGRRVLLQRPRLHERHGATPAWCFRASDPLKDPATFFYLGAHYAALYVTFPSPYSLDLHTFTLSTLGNLSDRSFITRFDYSLIAAHAPALRGLRVRRVTAMKTASFASA